jgi:hypothetical protein
LEKEANLELEKEIEAPSRIELRDKRDKDKRERNKRKRTKYSREIWPFIKSADIRNSVFA